MANTRAQGPDWADFRGYQSPNYTMVPDQLFDEHLAYLSGPELKVLLYIIRRTFGFKKSADAISISQMMNGIEKRDGSHLDHGVGLSKPTLLQALRSLVEKNLIASARQRSVERGDEPTIYWLRIAGADQPTDPGKEPLPPVVKKLDQGGGQETLPGPWSKNLTTQETVVQETVIQDVSSSNIRKRDLKGKKDLALDNLEARSPKALVFNDSTSLSRRGVETAPDAPRNGVASVGGILARRGAKRRPQGILRGQKTYSDERQQLLAFIKDFATEFRDEAPLSSSVSRAYNLYTRSGIPLEAFCSFMYEARSLTQEYTSNITKRRSGAPGAFGPELNKMPYFFSILEEVITQRSPVMSAPAPEGEPAEEHASHLLGDAQETRQEPVGAPVARTFPDTAEEPQRRSRRAAQRTVAPSVAIATYIKDVSVEYGQGRVDRRDQDLAHRLYTQSGLSEHAFLQVMDVARTLTTGTTSKEPGERMPVFLDMVREQLGLDEDSSPTHNTSRS